MSVIKLSRISIRCLLGGDESRPFTHYDLIDLACERGIVESADECLEERIAAILKRLVASGVLQSKIVPEGECGNSKDVIIHWIEGPGFHTLPPKRKLDNSSECALPKKKQFKPFRTPLKSLPREQPSPMQPQIDLASGEDLQGSSIQELLREKRSLEDKIADLVARKKRFDLAKLYKEKKNSELLSSIEKWRSVAISALEHIRNSIGPVDVESLNSSTSGNLMDFHRPESFSAPRTLSLPELARFLGIDYNIIDPGYEP